MTQDTKISNVPMIGPSFESRLEKLGIKTVKDLLWHIPFRYDDFSNIKKSVAITEGEIVTIQGKLLEIKNFRTKNGHNLQSAKIEDETGSVEAVWFNQRFLTSALHVGDSISLSGNVKNKKLESPSFEIMHGKNLHTGRLVPIYPETQGITSKWLRSRINFLLNNLAINDYLEDQEMSLNDALHQVHFPDSIELASIAKRRLAFDELLTRELEAKLQKQVWQQQSSAPKFENTNLNNFFKNLPFQLTPSQQKVIREIAADLKKTVPMNRLLQGDVGSGKTIVAAAAIQIAKENGFRSVLMAPTEILAVQHHQTLTKIFNEPVGLRTGNRKENENAMIQVGTHALLSENAKFSNLGLTVIDESHRFGVSQRAALTSKGANPHILTMTATPIPRTVALTLYGDLDISIIDELPKNRQKVNTWVVPKHKRKAAYDWIKKQNTQTFVVCPLIEESESETMLEVKAAKKEFETLSMVFSDQKLGLLHGKMKSSDKEAVLKDFRNKKLDMLVATPVIEVGIDIPEATIVIIEAADRFGLAQLHQLRGRVGRGEQKSYCLLFSENENGLPRLKNLERLNSGLKLAEIDLKFRGPGQRFGSAQHGKSSLKIADFSDLELIEATSKFAEKVLANPSNFSDLLKIIRESKINIVQN